MHCNWIIHIFLPVVVRCAASNWAEGSRALLGSFIKVGLRRMCLLLVLIAWGEIGLLHCGDDLATRVSPISLFSTLSDWSLSRGLILLKLSLQESQLVSSEHLKTPSSPPPPYISFHVLLLLPSSVNHITLINSWLINYLLFVDNKIKIICVIKAVFPFINKTLKLRKCSWIGKNERLNLSLRSHVYLLHS